MHTTERQRSLFFCLVPSLTSNNISKGRRRGGSPSTLSWSVALSAVHYSLEGSEEEEEEEGASLSGRGSATFVRSKRGGHLKGEREREKGEPISTMKPTFSSSLGTLLIERWRVWNSTIS